MLKRLYILILLMFAHSSMFAQQGDVAKFVDGNLVMKISVKLTQQELDSILRNMNMNSIEINRIRSGKLDSAYLSEGWKIIKATRDYIEISKKHRASQTHDGPCNRNACDWKHHRRGARKARFILSAS